MYVFVIDMIGVRFRAGGGMWNIEYRMMNDE